MRYGRKLRTQAAYGGRARQENLFGHKAGVRCLGLVPGRNLLVTGALLLCVRCSRHFIVCLAWAYVGSKSMKPQPIWAQGVRRLGLVWLIVAICAVSLKSFPCYFCGCSCGHQVLQAGTAALKTQLVLPMMQGARTRRCACGAWMRGCRWRPAAATAGPCARSRWTSTCSSAPATWRALPRHPTCWGTMRGGCSWDFAGVIFQMSGPRFQRFLWKVLTSQFVHCLHSGRERSALRGSVGTLCASF